MASLAKYRQIIGVIVAAGILAAIFVPFQTASAFTVSLDLPNVDDLDQVPTSAVGSTFEVTIDVEAGELISIDSIEIILDNGESSVKRAIFDSDGQRTDGSSTLTRGNIDIEYSGSLTNGYGYGYGLASDGTTFSPSYSYAFSYSYAYISGNTGGYSNAVGAQVNGLVGPGTITISGKLNTALMDAGVPHTLDVLINTGTGVNPDHLVAPQLVFTTVGNSSVQNVNVSTGNNVEATHTISGLGQLKVKFSQVLSQGELVIDKRGASALRQAINNTLGIDIFDSVSSGGNGKFQFGTNSGTTIGDVFDIDASSIEINSGGTYTLTVPYDEDELPNNLDEDEIKLFHFNLDTEEWEDITTDVDEDANTVTGETDSLSPLAVGYDDDDVAVSSSGGSGRGGGGGGGGGSSNPNRINPVDLTIFPDSYFVEFPLAKVQVMALKFLTSQGTGITQVSEGQQISISSTIKNYQNKDQNYVYIVLITDSNGFTTDLSWRIGTLTPGQVANVSSSWIADDEGRYTIKTFIWDGLGEAPIPLSEVGSSALRVVE